MLLLTKKQRNNFSKIQLFIVGEMHGAKENIRIIKELVNILDINIICFELETKWNKEFAHFNRNNFLYKLKKEQWILDSGLFSLSHVNLVSWLLRRKKSVCAVRKEKKDWNVSEKETALYINSLARKNRPERILVIVGNSHARKGTFTSKDEFGKKYIYKPMRLFLKDKAVSFLVRYSNSVAYNFGAIDLKDDVAYKKLEGLSMRVIPSSNSSFEYDILV
ncbi:MAG: hypothetical protein M1320_00250 [Patescibacteria group bacterium]|nr:hypothetical protein [Patescibacteria group bacterium]